MIRTKTIGRMPTDHGPYDPQLAYGKKFIVTLFDCGWESKHDNNTSAPATLNAQAGTITENTTDWKKKWGSYKQWLIDNGYQKMDASNVKDGNKTQNTINSETNTRLQSLESSVGSGGSVDLRIEAAKSEIKGNATPACDTLGEAEAKINANASAISVETSRAQAAEGALQQLYNSLTQSDIIVVADHTQVSSLAANTIYREQGTNSYIDWMYYNNAWQKMAEYDNAIDDEPSAGSNNLVKSGGVYDKCLLKYGHGTNLIDPQKITFKKYIDSTGGIQNTDSTEFGVSDFIPVNGNNITIFGKCSTGNAIRCYVVYANDKTTILYVAPNGGSDYYEYNSERGDAYIRIGTKTEMITESYPTYFANYGSTLGYYEAYTDYLPLSQNIQYLQSKIENNIINSVNIVNPSTISIGKFIGSDGTIGSGEETFSVTDFIPINGNNIRINGKCGTGDAVRCYVVYAFDKSTVLYVAPNGGSDHYEYNAVRGDAYIRIGFKTTNQLSNEYPSFFANYGDTLKSYNKYFSGSKETKEYLEGNCNGGYNIINPNTITQGKYIDGNGEIQAGSTDFSITDFIPVMSDIYIKGTASTGSVIRNYVVYAEDKTTLLAVADEGSEHYVYNPVRGDSYIRIGLKNTMLTTEYPTYFANFGNILAPYEKYEYINNYISANLLLNKINYYRKPVEDSELDFNSVSIIDNPSPLYGVWNDHNANRNYHNKVYIDHLIAGINGFEKKFGFRNDIIREYPIIGFYDNVNPSNSTPQNVVQIQETLNAVSGKNTKSITINKIITKASVGVNSKPRLLCIGDSVTYGAGAQYGRLDNMPMQYWSWVSWFFAKDKIDNNNIGHDFVSVGTSPFNSYFGISDTFVLNGVTYKNFATAKGGLAIQDLNEPSHGDDPLTPEIEGGLNPFYDESLDRFSFAFYLANFRTMDDNGNRLYFDANQSTTGTAGQGNIGYLADGTIATDGNGNTLYIGSQITDTESMNVCRPSHIVINLNHNSSYADYVSTLPAIISDIKNIVPDVFIILMNIDSTGTWSPDLYPKLPYEFAKIDTGLHNKNVSIYNYQQTLEDDTNKIYVCSGNLVQPLVDTIRGSYEEQADYIGNDNIMQNSISPTYPFAPISHHPNNLAHRGWGYQLYSLIKYTLSL